MKVPYNIAMLCSKHGGMLEGDAKGGVWWREGRAVASWGNMLGKVDTNPPDGDIKFALEAFGYLRDEQTS